MKHYIHIVTDSNRNYLHVGMANNLEVTSTYCKLSNMFANGWSSGALRLVYYEVFSNSEEALRRFNEVSRYTRMQKERLIRRRNPNWLDLTVRPLPMGVPQSDHMALRQFA